MTNDRNSTRQQVGVLRAAWPIYAWFTVSLALSALGGLLVHAAWSTRLNRVDLVTVSIATTAVILLSCALLAASMSSGSGPLLDGLRLRGGTGSLSVWVACLLGAPALGLFLDSGVALLGIEREGSLAVLFETMQRATPRELFSFAVAVSLGPGLAEELLFRGYCQTRLVERHGARTGIAIASALFGLIHMDPLHSALAGIMGIYLGTLAYRFDVRFSIAAHTFNNLIATVATVWMPDPEKSSLVALIFCVLGLTLFGGCLWYIGRFAGFATIPAQKFYRPKET